MVYVPYRVWGEASGQPESLQINPKLHDRSKDLFKTERFKLKNLTLNLRTLERLGLSGSNADSAGSLPFGITDSVIPVSFYYMCRLRFFEQNI